MPIRTYSGKLEVDSDRGVIYFHLGSELQVNRIGVVTLLRICQLPTPIPEGHIDLTHLHGVSYIPSSREQKPGT